MFVKVLGRWAHTILVCWFLVYGFVLLFTNQAMCISGGWMRTFVSAPLPSNVTMLAMFAGMRFSCGLAIATMKPTVRFYRAFMLLLLIPYLAFNAWEAYPNRKFIFKGGLWIDCIGNVLVALTCWAGAHHLQAQEKPPARKKSSRRKK